MNHRIAKRRISPLRKALEANAIVTLDESRQIVLKIGYDKTSRG